MQIDLGSLALWSAIAGSLATGLAALIALATYVRTALQRDADTLRDLLHDCESALHDVYMEFDQGGIVEAVDRVVSHPRFQIVAKEVWESRSAPEDKIKEILADSKLSIAHVISDAITSSDGRQSLAQAQKQYARALYKIRHRFPVLHEFLDNVESIMSYSVRVARRSNVYVTLIEEGILRMKDKGDLAKQRSPEHLSSFLYGIIVGNLQGYVESQRLNELLQVLERLLDGFLKPYRDAGNLRLWWMSRGERRTEPVQYVKAKLSEGFRALVDTKRRQLAESYGTCANLAGQAEMILKAQHDTP